MQTELNSNSKMINEMWVKSLDKRCKCGWKGKCYNLAKLCRYCLQDLDTSHTKGHRGSVIQKGGLGHRLIVVAFTC